MGNHDPGSGGNSSGATPGSSAGSAQSTATEVRHHAVPASRTSGFVADLSDEDEETRLEDGSDYQPPAHLQNRASPGRTIAISFLLLPMLGLWIKLLSVHVNWIDQVAVDWDHRREQVKTAYKTSWQAYTKYAWGQDRFHPNTKNGSQMSPEGLGWIIVDSLDTAMVMGLSAEVSQARDWIMHRLSYDQNQDVNTFETTIRMLGGLLSAHWLSTQLADVASEHDSVYLNRSIDLANRLLVAYDSPSGVPYASIDLQIGAGIVSHADGGASSTAETATLQLEMKYLSHLTNDAIYWRKAERVIEVLDSHAMRDGLLPIFVHPITGNFTSAEIRLGSRGDSYYEYLIKQYIQTREPIYLNMWNEALHGMRKHLITTTKHADLRIVAELPSGIGGQLSPKMDHLVCFLPGSIALGATEGLTLAEARKLPTWSVSKEHDMELAAELLKTCWAMYQVTATGLAPEIIWFEADDEALESFPGQRRFGPSSDSVEVWQMDCNIKFLDAHNLQRPETLESLFLMWRITEDPKYREWGWQIFDAFQTHTLVGDGEGYTSLHDVNAIPPPQMDNMESFWLAETLKYLYLLFSPPDYLPLTEVVFNTEAHIFPILKETKFDTGWVRNSNRTLYKVDSL